MSLHIYFGAKQMHVRFCKSPLYYALVWV